MYRVFISEECQKRIEKSDQREKKWIEKMKEKLAQEISGKILRVHWFREKRFE